MTQMSGHDCGLIAWIFVPQQVDKLCHLGVPWQTLGLQCARLRHRRPGLAAVPGALAARYASVKAAGKTGAYTSKLPRTTR